MLVYRRITYRRIGGGIIVATVGLWVPGPTDLETKITCPAAE